MNKTSEKVLKKHTFKRKIFTHALFKVQSNMFLVLKFVKRENCLTQFNLDFKGALTLRWRLSSTEYFARSLS